MAKVFLDANYFIDAIIRRPEKKILESLVGHIPFITPLSVHIYCYSYKIELPNGTLSTQVKLFQLVGFSEEIWENSLLGPTKDFEDNVQLNSAAQAKSDFFLTSDKKLLRIGFFGKTQLVQSLPTTP